MVGKNNEDREVKKEILKKHTLKGVITLNTNTFQDKGSNTCIAIFEVNKPHDFNKYCKFINFEDDGYVIYKHSGLVKTERAKERKQRLLDCWLNDAPADTKFMVKTQIKDDDEWLYSYYYYNDELPSQEKFEKTVTEYLTFEFEQVLNNRAYLFGDKDE